MAEFKVPDQIIPPRLGNPNWRKGMPRIPGSGRKPGQLSRRRKLLDYVAMLESTCNLETADPGKILIHVAATGRDPRFKGELREKFKYESEAHALACMRLATENGEKMEFPIAGRDYPYHEDLRMRCAMRMIQHIYPRLGATKLTLDEGDGAEQNELDSAAVAQQLSQVPEVRDALEIIARKMSEV